MSNIEKLHTAIRDDAQLNELAMYKVNIYERACPRIWVNIKANRVDIIYGDEANRLIEEVDKLIEVRIKEIKAFYDRK